MVASLGEQQVTDRLSAGGDVTCECKGALTVTVKGPGLLIFLDILLVQKGEEENKNIYF